MYAVAGADYQLAHDADKPAVTVVETEAAKPTFADMVHNTMMTAAWATGLSLLFIGIMGISMDRLLLMFDLMCIAVGLFAIPPLTALARARWNFPPHGVLHFLLAIVLLAGALAFDFARGGTSAALYPVVSHPREATFASFEQPMSPATAAQLQAAKADYLADVLSQTKAFDKERALMTETGSSPSDYDDAMLARRADLVRARAGYTLTPDEAAIVNALASRVSTARAAMAPALRRAYIEELNGPLQQYAITARMAGEDTIEFVGLNMADAATQQKMLSLTQAQRTRLGFAYVRFSISSASQATRAEQPAPAAKVGPTADASAAPATAG